MRARGEEVVHHWDLRVRPPVKPVDNYEDDPSKFDYYGYNFEKMDFPFYRDEKIEKRFREKDAGNLHLPTEIKPKWNPTILCSHGLTFDPSDDALILVMENVTVYDQKTETMRKVLVFGRKTIGICNVSIGPQYIFIFISKF